MTALMTALRVITVGFDRRESTFVRTTIELASGLEIGQWQYVDDRGDADVILINTDTVRGQAIKDRYAVSGIDQEPLVISCTQGANERYSSSLSLKRPIAYAALITLLKKLQVELQKASESMIRAEPAAPREEEMKKDEDSVPSSSTVSLNNTEFERDSRIFQGASQTEVSKDEDSVPSSSTVSLSDAEIGRDSRIFQGTSQAEVSNDEDSVPSSSTVNLNNTEFERDSRDFQGTSKVEVAKSLDDGFEQTEELLLFENNSVAPPLVEETSEDPKAHDIVDKLVPASIVEPPDEDRPHDVTKSLVATPVGRSTESSEWIARIPVIIAIVVAIVVFMYALFGAVELVGGK